jgi:uncharacterized protein
MNSTYFSIAFTPNVRAIQKSMKAPYRLDVTPQESSPEATPEPLSTEALQFISERDSFYMASTSETGWPYVQHKGGPRGFLMAISQSELAFPDFAGNKQYISAGNLTENTKAALILTDYLQRQRLKLFVIAQLRSPDAEPSLLKAFAKFQYPVRIERIIVFTVVAFNWNCPNHIHVP